MYDITGAVSLWDHLAETSKPIIIYGMGDGAQKILDVCSLKNVKNIGIHGERRLRERSQLCGL